MVTARKLNQEREREAALVYLCGVENAYIRSNYHISESTIRNLILGQRSYEWQDPLVEFYRKINEHNRETNSAHMFLSFQAGDFKPEPADLINQTREEPVYKLVKEKIYLPALEEVLDRTALREYVKGNRPYDLFVSAIFGGSYANAIANKILVTVLRDIYKPSEPLSLKEVFSSVGNIIIDKVREGGLAWTDLKKSVVHKALDTLTDNEKAVLGTRLGLDGYVGPKILEEIAQDYNVTREDIRQIETRALKKLCLPNRSKQLRSLMDLATDADVKSYLAKAEAPKTIEEIGAGSLHDELNLSVKTEEALGRLGIKTVDQLRAMTKLELLNAGRFKKTAFNEIQKELNRLGLSLKN